MSSNSWNKLPSDGKLCLLQHPREDRYWTELKQKLWRKDSLGDSRWPGLWSAKYDYFELSIHESKSFQVSWFWLCHPSPLYEAVKQSAGPLSDPFICPKSAVSQRKKRVELFISVLLKPPLVDGCMLICCHVNRTYIKHGLIKSSWNKKITSATRN